MSMHSAHGRLDPACAIAGPTGATRSFQHTCCSQGTLSRTQAPGRQYHPSSVTGRLALGEVENHADAWDQLDTELDPELDAWNEHKSAEQRRLAAVRKLQAFRYTLLQRVRSRHRQELAHQPSLDVQRVQQQAHKQRMAALAQTIRAENAKSISLPLSRPQAQAQAAPQITPHGRGRSRDRPATMRAAQTQRTVGPMQPRPDKPASQRSLRIKRSPEDSIQMTGATAPGGRAAHSPDRAASRGRYAGEPASSPEVAVATKVQYRAHKNDTSPIRRPASTEAADKRAQERLDALRQRFKLTPIEARKLQATAVKLDRLAFQVAEKHIHLPQLCMCHMTPPLQPEYPYLCAANCALHRNPAAYEALLKSLLAAYGISLKEAE